MDLTFKRIQFTPDLMPDRHHGHDGASTRRPGRHEFRFVEGPIFANIILADEINRTPPEDPGGAARGDAGAAGHGGEDEPRPAASRSSSSRPRTRSSRKGTYPLPEAQQDRFMYKVVLDYPSHAEEDKIVLQTTSDQSARREVRDEERRDPSGAALMEKVAAAPYVVHYATALVRADEVGPAGLGGVREGSRPVGAGPRASQFLIRGAKALAAMDGRSHISTQDIREVALPVLRHRIATSFQAQSEGRRPAAG
jgi:MoxR-like ATPase